MLIYVHIKNNKIHKTISQAGGTVNVDLDEYGTPVGIEIVGAWRVDVNGRPVATEAARRSADRKGSFWRRLREALGRG